MTDEQHAEYYKNNPMGNHNEPSAKTLEYLNKVSGYIGQFDVEIKNLKTELKEFKEEIKGLRTDVANYLNKESERWDKWTDLLSGVNVLKNRVDEAEKERDDHELRIRRVERWGMMGIGALGLAQFLVAWLK